MSGAKQALIIFTRGKLIMPVPIIVLNFGHSVLRTLDDYTEAASEIYRYYRQGKNVVAVTSA